MGIRAEQAQDVQTGPGDDLRLVRFEQGVARDDLDAPDETAAQVQTQPLQRIGARHHHAPGAQEQVGGQCFDRHWLAIDMRVPASLVGQRRARRRTARRAVHAQGSQNALAQGRKKAQASDAPDRDGGRGMTGIDIGEAAAKRGDGRRVPQAREHVLGREGGVQTELHQTCTRQAQPVAAQVTKRHLLRDPGVVQLELRHVPHDRIVPAHQPVGHQGSQRGRNEGLAARADVEACVQGDRVVARHRLAAPGQVVAAVIDHQRDRCARDAQRTQMRIADPRQPGIQQVEWKCLDAVHGDGAWPQVDRSNNCAAGSPRTAQGSSMRGKKSPSRWV